MKITYTPNPLETKVELEDHEKELLRLKIKLGEYEDMIFGAHYTLTTNGAHGRERTMDEVVADACKELDPDYWCDDGNKLDKRVDELLQHYIEELQFTHLGDCTAFPMSCSKCHAEEKLGINTLGTYPGKSVLHAISHAFNYREGDEWKTRTTEEALEKLTGHARDYLTTHLNTHFPKD